VTVYESTRSPGGRASG